MATLGAKGLDPIPDEPLTLEALLRLGKNRDTFRLLGDQLACRLGVVPFVGAGLSIPSGMPGWANFLRTAAREVGAECEATVEGHIQRGEFEEAAEYLALQQGSQWFEDTLESCFGPDLIKDKPPRGAVTLLPRLVRGPVIMTNLDRVLEKVFEPQPFEEKVWGASASLVADALYSDQRYLLKVHGDVLDTKERVLTLSDYRDHYGSDSVDGVDLSKPLPGVLGAAFTSRTLLFLGCSLSIDRTVRLLERVSKPTSPTHYAIVERPADGHAATERAQFFSNRRIRPLWFPERRFDAIELLVEALATRVQNLSTTASRRSTFFRALLLIPAILGGFIFAGPWIQRVLSMWQIAPWMQFVSLFLVGLSLAGIATHRRWQQGPGIPLERLKLSPSIANGLFGGLFGGMIAGVVVAYAYHSLPDADPSIASPPAIILYCVLTAVVLGAAIQPSIVALMRSAFSAAAPVFVNEGTGGLLGGALAGALCGAVGGWYFGRLEQPPVTSGIVMIGAMLGAIAIAAGYLVFNYVGSLKRAARVAVVAAVFAGLCGVIGLVSLDYQNLARLFMTRDPVKLAYAGAIVGGIAGAMVGLQVGLTLLFYRLWDERGV